MTPIQDTIALCAAAAVGLMLIAVAPAQTVPSLELAQGGNAQEQRPTASVRDLCREDMTKFCADAAGPQKMKSCMQGNVRQLKPACRSALEAAGMIEK